MTDASAPTSGRAGRTGLVLSWGLALLTTAIRYPFQRVPLYRRDRHGEDTPLPDLDRRLPGDPTTLQRASDGLGTLFHRRYWISLTDEELGPEALIDHIVAQPNDLAPKPLARFETTDGGPARDLQVGDEVVVRLPGPWNGPVRVIERTPRSLRLATMIGHMEAGEIEFRAGRDDRGFLVFEINSWACSGDRLFHLLYERFPVGREAQLHTWARFCQRVAAVAGGVRMSHVTCSTRSLETADA